MKNRISSQPHEFLDRENEIKFQWNGSSYTGYGGDTLASALLANGETVCSYSFKYGRARGIYSAWADDPNAIVTLEMGKDRVPNARATETELYEGLRAVSTGIKAKRLLRFIHPLLVAGFYYKTFKKPQFLWPLYENIIRRLAGLSPAPTEADTEIYDYCHHHCDVLIVGGGVAGLRMAELLATEENKKILLIDDRARLGGQWYTDIGAQVAGKTVAFWIRETAERLRKKITILSRTTVWGLYEDNLALATERIQDHISIKDRDAAKPRQREHKIRARQVIFATGACERPIIFPSNDLPGIMLASAVQAYINCYGVLPGRHTLIYTNNDAAYSLVDDLLAAGALRVRIVDTRQKGNEDYEAKEGVDIFTGYEIVKAHGKEKITGVTIAPLAGGATLRIAADLVATSGGFDPVVHLACQRGMKPRWSNEVSGFLIDDIRGAGGADGYHSAKSAYQSAELVVERLNNPAVRTDELRRSDFNIELKLWTEKPQGKGKQFVDMQNDVTTKDIELAVRENYASIEHIKRYTVMGFGNDQGKLSNIIGFHLAARLLKLPINQVGTTTYRPPYAPISFGSIVGVHRDELYDPRRYTPMHFVHKERTDKWEVVAQWMRPHYYPRGSETMAQTLTREGLAARQKVAMMDVSTLGKIDVQGEDAREFLNRIYPNSWTKLAPGKCRYGILLKEDGMVFDDGVTICINDKRFLLTTTTGNAAVIYSWLEMWLQTEWPELRVYLTSVTDHWATTAVVGPMSRAVMRKLCKDVDFSIEAFAFMEWRNGTVCGIPARIMRISFSGELAYEINVQANYGGYIWKEVAKAGEEFGITPYGTETMHVLRAEKGYIIAGQDTDGTMTPLDLDLGWVIAKKKQVSFIGDRSLLREAMQQEDRLQLVGLLTKDAETMLPEGCALTDETRKKNQGFVSSSYHSPILGRPIALALVEGGSKRKGETIYGYHYKRKDLIAAEIGHYVFYDPQGERKDG